MRVKGGLVSHRRHKKVIQASKGYRMSRHLLFSTAHQAQLHAGQYSYEHRKKRGGDFHRIWVTRINAAVRQSGITYSTFVRSLRQKNIQLNRHVLAEIAVTFPETFARIVDTIKK